MNQPQFNIRVSPDIKDKYNGFMDRYKDEGRINTKGDFFGICLNDHLEKEKERLFIENCRKETKEGIDHLKRLLTVFQQIEVNNNNEISLLTKRAKDEIHLKDLHIQQLEEKVHFLKEQLQEKILENDTLRKGIEKIQKREERKKA